MGRDALVGEALKALQTCTEADKELTTDNTVLGIVGVGEAFHIIEGDALAPFLLGLVGGARGAGAAAAAVDADGDEAMAGAGVAGGAAAAGPGAGAGVGAGDGKEGEADRPPQGASSATGSGGGFA